MSYEWDPEKATANAKKHGVRFSDAVIALEDDIALTVPDPDSEDEERFVSLGCDAINRILVTVFTLRGTVIRIISSRKASKSERKRYEAT